MKRSPKPAKRSNVDIVLAVVFCSVIGVMAGLHMGLSQGTAALDSMAKDDKLLMESQLINSKRDKDKVIELRSMLDSANLDLATISQQWRATNEELNRHLAEDKNGSKTITGLQVALDQCAKERDTDRKLRHQMNLIFKDKDTEITKLLNNIKNCNACNPQE